MNVLRNNEIRNNVLRNCVVCFAMQFVHCFIVFSAVQIRLDALTPPPKQSGLLKMIDEDEKWHRGHKTSMFGSTYCCFQKCRICFLCWKDELPCFYGLIVSDMDLLV